MFEDSRSVGYTQGFYNGWLSATHAGLQCFGGSVRVNAECMSHSYAASSACFNLLRGDFEHTQEERQEMRYGG